MSKLPVIAQHTLEKFSLAERQGGSDIEETKARVFLGCKIILIR